MSPLDTIAEGERLLAAYEASIGTDGVMGCMMCLDRWMGFHAPALLAVARAAANLCAHENTKRRPEYECAFADDDALGVLASALDRLTPENPDA